MSYTVEQRSHEFGIRAPFGARNGDILRLVLREGGLVTMLGLTIGLGGAFGAKLIASQLFGVTPMDPITILAVAIVLVAIALLACYIPARRATRVDPLSVTTNRMTVAKAITCKFTSRSQRAVTERKARSMQSIDKTLIGLSSW
jgi:ABC-type lipoprotein release transport system permease subunit